MQKIGGTAALDQPYLEMPLFSLFKKRVVWLVVLFLGEMLTATAMAYFEDEIARAVVLALFVPLIISSGGNSGSQASTLIIQAMAVGEISLKDWWKVMRREIISGLLLGSVLCIIGFFQDTGLAFHQSQYLRTPLGFIGDYRGIYLTGRRTVGNTLRQYAAHGIEETRRRPGR